MPLGRALNRVLLRDSDFRLVSQRKRDLHTASKCIDNALRLVHGDTVIFIPLVARNTRFTDSKPIRPDLAGLFL